MKKEVTTFTLGILLSLLCISPVHAACNFHQLMTTGVKNITNFTSTCTITAVEGIDNPGGTEASSINTAALTLGTNSSITINNGGQLVTGTMLVSGGVIAVQNGGLMKFNTPIYVADADADGWPSDLTFFTATSSGRRRLGLMRGFSTTDCGDSNFSTANTCGTANGGACTADIDCVSTICGTNVDGDSYFSLAAGHSGTCQASSLPYTDCYDSNANAYPGSSYCSSTHRGDSSYDYNCSSSNDACSTTRYSSTTVDNYDFACGPGDSQCCPVSTSTVTGGGVSCGTTGYARGSSWTHRAGCYGGSPTSTVYGLGSSGTQACQ